MKSRLFPIEGGQQKLKARQSKFSSNIDNQVNRWSQTFKSEELETEWRLWMIQNNKMYLVYLMAFVTINNLIVFGNFLVKYKDETSQQVLTLGEIGYTILGLVATYQIYYSAHA